MAYTHSDTLARDIISLETGNWAKQADGSVVYRSGNLVLLATVCATDEPREGQDFFPLTVEYSEKMYAVGKIPGGYFKREARPAEHEILLSRIIDRPIRPMFPEGYFCEVQLLVTVLSADKSISIAGHALNAASAALLVSDIPFPEAIGGVRVGRVHGELICNPTTEEMLKSDLDLIVAGTKNSIVMLEGEANEVSNVHMLDALKFAHENIKQAIHIQETFIQSQNIIKKEIVLKKKDEDLHQQIRDFAFSRLVVANKNSDKLAREKDIKSLNDETIKHFNEKIGEDKTRDISSFLHELEFEVVRDAVINEGIRADGRKTEEIRQISCEINVLPGAHGSAVFTRGQTQSLGVMTLGTQIDNQRYETLEGQKEKNFMLHYNFPPYSVGEVRKNTGPGRREIGHGNLAERALKKVVPQTQDFPYVIRLVSEIMESNGSSSMASVCSGSLALMAGGVPIRSTVAGIAMGLMSDDKGNYAILSDIAGLEDHFGDMDFKLAGTRNGVTACQMDLKVNGLGIEMLAQVFDQAEKGRLHIMNEMEKAISTAADNLSDNAPRITFKEIPKDKIGELIGPGGRNIRYIIEQTNCELNVDDSGKVTITSNNNESTLKAIELIDALTQDLVVGKIYEGTVKKIVDFGAFVEVIPGKEGLCHISKLDTQRVANVADVVSVGEKIKVKVLNVDKSGKIDLSRRDALMEV